MSLKLQCVNLSAYLGVFLTPCWLWKMGWEGKLCTCFYCVLNLKAYFL